MAVGAPKGNTNRKGKPGKRTEEVREKLAALNCDPIEGMARIAKMAETAFFDNLKELANGAEIQIPGLYKDLNLAGSMYKELAQYIAPKLKAIEISVDPETTQKEAIIFTRATKQDATNTTN